jgi:hypothetical protein
MRYFSRLGGWTVTDDAQVRESVIDRLHEELRRFRAGEQAG